jgi:hypothetical protein
MKDVEIIGMLKSYISKSLVGMGALKGANCQIESIAEVTGGQKITFLWIDTNNVSHRSELTVPNGADGFSPSIVEDPDNTNDIYKLDITTKEGTFVTPNLKAEGSINSISVNGVAQTVINKAVNLDVASNLITEDQWEQIQVLLV